MFRNLIIPANTIIPRKPKLSILISNWSRGRGQSVPLRQHLDSSITSRSGTSRIHWPIEPLVSSFRFTSSFPSELNEMPAKAAKQVLRVEMKRRLKEMTDESRQIQSRRIVRQILSSEIYQNSERIGVYLSMPEEVQTDDIVRDILKKGKSVFVPLYDKHGMDMVKLKSIQDFETLPRTKLGIRQPSREDIREHAFPRGLDLVIVPGLAFGHNGRRLGRGGGYYDRYLCQKRGAAYKTPLSDVAWGVCFRQQLSHKIPMESYDVTVDRVIFGEEAWTEEEETK